MSRYCDVSSALTLLVLLTGMSYLPLSTPTPINTPGDIDNPHRATPPGPRVSVDVEKRDEEGELIKKEGAALEEEDTDELFKDVDPKTLAAVLLEALNWSQAERRREEDGYDGREEETKDAREESREMRMTEGEEKDRDGRQKLDLLMAAQGNEAEERQVQEEEEKLTEKVTSRTTSQTIQTEKEQQPVTADGREEDTEAAGSLHQGTQNGNEEEEQLSPEELKSLETVMKEFPSLSTVSKRERDSEQSQRSGRAYSAYNNVLLKNKGSDLAMSKKKLKWQEETQKALNFPTSLGGNFMDEFEDSRYAGGNAAAQQPPAEKDVVDGNEAEEEEEEEEEEELSPEEEEAQAKAEQEEMRRQAAEAQRAKLEEEKLADIASDMLLRYMVKQNNGEKKYGSALSNAAEDKRSDEEQEVTEEDIDPQTIDKLIEISSKLHLPADDVVDIISDVEKKKKKDIPSEMISHFRQPVTPLASPSLLTTDGFSVPQSSNNQNNFPVFKQPSPGASVLKTWFQDKSPVQSQDRWFKPASQNLWFKPRKPLSIKQDLFYNSPKSVWTSYPPYFHYPSYYQKKPSRDHYPFYFPASPRQRPRYYFPKPGLALNNFLDSSMDDPYSFPSKHRFYNWVQPRLRKPPSDIQQKSYYTSYSRPLYHQTFQPVPLLKPRAPPRMALLPTQQKQFYYLPAAPAVNKNGDYYSTMVGNRLDNTNRDDLKKYIQQILAKQPQMFD